MDAFQLVFSNRWSIFSTTILPTSLTGDLPVHSLCPVLDLSESLGVAGGNMLVGVAGGNMLLWYVVRCILE